MMKKILFIAGILAAQLSFAQQGAFSEVTIQNPSPILYLKRSTNDGGFIRGIQTQYLNGTNGWFFGDLHGSQWIVSKGDYTNPKLVINDSNGNVGIGVASPNGKLHVAQDNVNDQNLVLGKFSSFGPTGGSAIVRLVYNSTTANLEVNSTYSGNNFRYGTYGDFNIENEITTPDFGAINFITNKKVQMAIKPNGNALLQGKLEAKEIKVTLTPTADFVFEENYNLPNLEEVAKHIKEKKHLPEIASAKMMEKEGVNVGEFQIKLLQKIEELTLYAIKQERQLKDQQEKIQKLEGENSELKNVVSEIKQLKEQFLIMKSNTTR
ncbi:hypothetical protein NK356_20785 [Chryseobacterium sp. S0630]|uniref:hypothetical protein n=1 Tax=Chryseobacterium sp. S0630 TaxID=2957803 RepID=UPI00209C7523|nr:hypothetical protein [Chryseobacterium sp. S0630]MCP1301616.1 hypothetical protein [Chryseobacterium sp. S0630]